MPLTYASSLNFAKCCKAKNVHGKKIAWRSYLLKYRCFLTLLSKNMWHSHPILSWNPTSWMCINKKPTPCDKINSAGSVTHFSSWQHSILSDSTLHLAFNWVIGRMLSRKYVFLTFRRVTPLHYIFSHL